MAKDTSSGNSVPTKKPRKSSSGAQFAICVPSSVISRGNARNLEQITNIAYQIARAATIFNVSEIIILNVPGPEEIAARNEAEAQKTMAVSGGSGNKKISFNLTDDDLGPEVSQKTSEPEPELVESPDNENNGLLLATLLQFFVTPPYLVKGVFRESTFRHKFKYAEKLPKLSTLPFMNNNNVIQDFKEGLSVPKHTPRGTSRNRKVSALKKLQVTKYINIGQASPIILNGAEVPINVRVTVDVKNKKIVSPQAAYGKVGSRSSFGYFVRYANSITSVFTELPLPNGYSESFYVSASDYFSSSGVAIEAAEAPKEGHVLMVVSSIKDLNEAFNQEKISGVDNVTDMFDGQIPVPEGLRIEDALMIALTKSS